MTELIADMDQARELSESEGQFLGETDFGDDFGRGDFINLLNVSIKNKLIAALNQFTAIATLNNGGAVQTQGSGGAEEGLGRAYGANAFVCINPGWRGIYALEKLPEQVQELAAFLDEDVAVIQRILNEGTAGHYRRFSIPKSDGRRRWIAAPTDELKRIQRKILHRALYRMGVSRQAHGFVLGRSIVTNAMVHAQAHAGERKYVVKVDVKDFFPSFKRDMVKAAIAPFLTHPVSRFAEPLVELCLLDGALPQGAPTSPALTNVAMAWVDFALVGISRRLSAMYTRYADDLVFSSRFRDIYKIIPLSRRVLAMFGLTANCKKIGYFGPGRRQKVTGIVINDKVSAPRDRRMRLRAKLHNIIVGRTPVAEVNMAQLKGEVGFVRMVNAEQGDRLGRQLEQVEALLRPVRARRRRRTRQAE